MYSAVQDLVLLIHLRSNCIAVHPVQVFVSAEKC